LAFSTEIHWLFVGNLHKFSFLQHSYILWVQSRWASSSCSRCATISSDNIFLWFLSDSRSKIRCWHSVIFFFLLSSYSYGKSSWNFNITFCTAHREHFAISIWLFPFCFKNIISFRLYSLNLLFLSIFYIITSQTLRTNFNTN